MTRLDCRFRGFPLDFTSERPRQSILRVFLHRDTVFSRKFRPVLLPQDPQQRPKLLYLLCCRRHGVVQNLLRKLKGFTVSARMLYLAIANLGNSQSGPCHQKLSCCSCYALHRRVGRSAGFSNVFTYETKL